MKTNDIEILSETHKYEIHPSSVDGEFAVVHDGEVYQDHLTIEQARRIGRRLVASADALASFDRVDDQ
jgi:hypothetical protein